MSAGGWREREARLWAERRLRLSRPHQGPRLYYKASPLLRYAFSSRRPGLLPRYLVSVLCVGVRRPYPVQESAAFGS